MNIHNLTKKELIKFVKKLNIKNYSKYNKKFLKKYIINHKNYKEYLINKNKNIIIIPVDIINIINNYKIGLEGYINNIKGRINMFKYQLGDDDRYIVDYVINEIYNEFIFDKKYFIDNNNKIDILIDELEIYVGNNAIISRGVDEYINNMDIFDLEEKIEEYGGVLGLIRNYDATLGISISDIINNGDASIYRMLLFSYIRDNTEDIIDFRELYNLLLILIQCGCVIN